MDWIALIESLPVDLIYGAAALLALTIIATALNELLE